RQTQPAPDRDAEPATVNATSPPPARAAARPQPTPDASTRARGISSERTTFAIIAVIVLIVGISGLVSWLSESSPTSSSPLTPSPSQTTATPAANKSDVRVYNISTTAGLAGRIVDQLTAGGFNATIGGNLDVPAPPDVPT